MSAVSNTLRLLRLPEAVRQALLDGRLREGQARPLVNLDEKVINDILPRILEEEWSARKIEQFIVQIKKAAKSPIENDRKKVVATPYENETQHLGKRLSTDVSVKTNAKGAGQIVIRFKSDQDFQRIKKLLGD